MLQYQYLQSVVENKGAGYIVLIDPDRKNDGNIEAQVRAVNHSGADVIFVGGSLMMDGKFHDRMAKIKELAEVPVIFFPGSSNQLNAHVDALLFMSLISGRNPQYLIGEQVISAPIVKDLGLEAIPTGYILMDGGAATTVEFMSGTQPIPADRPDIAVAHALAAQYLGMRLIYLEAGSGAKNPVYVKTIQIVADQVDVPIVVGGGIRTPNEARKRVEAGASFIVTGSIIEESASEKLMQSFADAIHWKEQS
ncbi:MAG: geranylgeranylglyceryl/heptaprenylglyceryl phosphate synthase [Candidatus Marinimicrobia bacterium]|nr:geranylgeranylglyceryl/heptaprenylglyceryl phosphate synthase [Candidatus Neomarinimicrobiota bacterium]